MPSYTFVIKKENMVFEFTTDNKDFIDKEFEKWINSISDKQKKQPAKVNKKEDIKPKEQPQKILPDNVEQEVSSVIEEIVESCTQKQGRPQEVIQEGDIVVSETPSAFQKLSKKLSEESFDESIEEIQEIAEVENNIKKEPEENPVEEVELDFATVSIDGDDDLIELEEVDFTDSEFDSIFQEKINSDLDEYSVKENKKFANFIQGKKLEKPVDGLVLIAKYLLDIENKDRFVMKDIMDLSVENSVKNIDYALITKAVSLGVVKVVPDLTGIADVVEYALTPKGEDYFNG